MSPGLILFKKTGKEILKLNRTKFLRLTASQLHQKLPARNKTSITRFKKQTTVLYSKSHETNPSTSLFLSDPLSYYPLIYAKLQSCIFSSLHFWKTIDPEQDSRKHSDFNLVLIPPFSAVLIYCSQIFEIWLILVDSKPVYYKYTVGSQHLIFWPSSQRRVHEHTAQLEPNLRILINCVSYNPITVLVPNEVRAFLGWMTSSDMGFSPSW